MKFILWIFAVAYVCVALTLCDHNGKPIIIYNVLLNIKEIKFYQI